MPFMKPGFLVALLVCSSLAWPGMAQSQLARQADLGVATLTLLPGYSNKLGRGMDSIPGSISSKNARFVIGYDIGQMAGDYVARRNDYKFVWEQEQQVNGNKAKFVLAKSQGKAVLLVTIYRAGKPTFSSPANFSATIAKQTDLADALLMLQSFRWKPIK